MGGLKAGHSRTGTGSSAANFKDSKGATKDVVAEVTNEHLTARELQKRKAAQNKGARR